IISVNRMEIGASGKTAIDDIKEEFGITVHSIVTVRDIIEHMHNREIDGQVLLTDEIREKMEAYMAQYCK
ncbi:MAG: orotate phosphoribosyltransferase, partial [Clostridia bacterium]|nr:orotate phosphoribosyltransferase [Clostridia bacterium]